MERWERELRRLNDVGAPASTRSRMEAGPTGDGMPPTPNRGQRVAAGVVACLVFLLGAALVTAAFRGGPEGPVVGAAPDAAVLTLAAEPNDAVASLAYRDATVDPVVDSYCWNQENGAQRCADVAMAEPFAPSDYLSIPEGTAFALVNDDGADPVTLALAPGNDPYDIGVPTTLDDLGHLAPRRYVLTVTANWDGRGENVSFHFPVEVVEADPTPTPTGSASPVPTVSPEDPSDDGDGELERSLAGSSWQLGSLDGAMLDLAHPPTMIVGDPRVVGWTGCNGYGAESWRIEDGHLILGETAMTLVLCADETDAIEGMFMDVIGSEPTVAIDGFTLTLTAGDHTATMERIDVDHDDIVGSFLDCAVDDRVDVGPTGNAILQPGLPAYFTVNLPWIERSDELERIAGSPELDQASRWIVVRDGLVIAEVDYPDLSGIACAVAGA